MVDYSSVLLKINAEQISFKHPVSPSIHPSISRRLPLHFYIKYLCVFSITLLFYHSLLSVLCLCVSLIHSKIFLLSFFCFCEGRWGLFVGSSLFRCYCTFFYSGFGCIYYKILINILDKQKDTQIQQNYVWKKKIN